MKRLIGAVIVVTVFGFLVAVGTAGAASPRAGIYATDASDVTDVSARRRYRHYYRYGYRPYYRPYYYARPYYYRPYPYYAPAPFPFGFGFGFGPRW